MGQRRPITSQFDFLDEAPNQRFPLRERALLEELTEVGHASLALLGAGQIDTALFELAAQVLLCSYQLLFVVRIA